MTDDEPKFCGNPNFVFGWSPLMASGSAHTQLGDPDGILPPYPGPNVGVGVEAYLRAEAIWAGRAES